MLRKLNMFEVMTGKRYDHLSKLIYSPKNEVVTIDRVIIMNNNSTKKDNKTAKKNEQLQENNSQLSAEEKERVRSLEGAGIYEILEEIKQEKKDNEGYRL
jgi:hypothetical protein